MATTPKTKQQRRAEELDRRAKVEQMRRQAKAKERRKTFGIVGSAVLVCLLLIGVVLWSVDAKNAKSRIAGVVNYPKVQSHQHVTGTVKYNVNPPVGGDHDGTWLNCGIYDKPVRNENAVHDMEHGAVWITYQPSLSTADVATLRSYVKGKTYLTLSPYPGLPTPVVLSAWDNKGGHQLRLSSVSDPRIQRFIARYRLDADDREAGASCSGGTGTPLKADVAARHTRRQIRR